MDNLRYHNSHAHHLRHQQQQQQQQQHNSMPNSPNEMDMGHRGTIQPHCKSGPNSTNTSPVSANKRDHHNHHQQQQQLQQQQHSPADPYSSNNYVRTSRSEDQLQAQNDCITTGNIDVDEDVTSSLNTLLDTRPDSANSCGGGVGGGGSGVVSGSDSDRIVWTYNAPITDQHKFTHTLSNGSSSSHSNNSPTSSSPLHSGSPASPTSVSSSVMSSQSGSKRMPISMSSSNGPQQQQQHTTGDFSVSEAISNISSPDYHDDDSVGIRDCVMEISDHSDSDSTLLVSEPKQRRKSGQGAVMTAATTTTTAENNNSDHRIVIQVRGPEKAKQNNNESATIRANEHYGYQVNNYSMYFCYLFYK